MHVNCEQSLAAVGRTIDEFLACRSPKAKAWLAGGAAVLLLAPVVWFILPSESQPKHASDAAQLRTLATKRDAVRSALAAPAPIKSERRR
jgi:hypothetical protein